MSDLFICFSLQISANETIKLADVGTSKQEGDLADIIYPLSNYSAPEVIEGREYTNKGDIFSFSFIVWELWYGCNVALDKMTDKEGKFHTTIREGNRPSVLIQTEPPDAYKDLLHLCWSHDARKRPNSQECYQFFENIEHIPGKG